jgi:hypothetical protein
MAEGRQWKRLTARRKFEVFLATRGDGARVGEILRRHALTLDDLRAIEAAVEDGAVAALKVRAGHRLLGQGITAEMYETLADELRAKEKAFADLMVEYTLLKKSQDSVSSGGATEATSRGRRGRRSGRRSTGP